MVADIGIDLGTKTVIIYDSAGNRLLYEPSVVVVNRVTDKIVAVGSEAMGMLGRVPDRLEVIRPMANGVISDYKMAKELVVHLCRKVYASGMIKPRVAVCVPSVLTKVEAQAVVDAAVAAGARKVYLIEEPIAAAIGAGLDISKPEGRMVVDIGGGTTDIAVLSLYGVVVKSSAKIGGNRLDEEIIRHVRLTHGLLIGESMAEKIKISIAAAASPDKDATFIAKGRSVITGLPASVEITALEISRAIRDSLQIVIDAIHSVLEQTPPELASDLYRNGILLTGGGALLKGLDELITRSVGLKVSVADDTINCVALGTAKCFDYIGKLYDGFNNSVTNAHK